MCGRALAWILVSWRYRAVATALTLTHSTAGRRARRRASALHRATTIATVGADIPLEFKQMVAARAGATQLRAAGGAKLEIALDTVVTRRAGLPLGHLRKQGFLFELALIEFSERLAGPHNQIDEQSTDTKNRYKDGRGDLQNDVLCPRANIAPGPEDERNPEDQKEGEEEKGSDSDEPRIGAWVNRSEPLRCRRQWDSHA